METHAVRIGNVTRRFVTEIQPGNRSHDALEVVVDEPTLAAVKQLPGPVWAVCEFTERKKPLLCVLALAVDAPETSTWIPPSKANKWRGKFVERGSLTEDGAVVNLLAANLFAEDGTRLSRAWTIEKGRERRFEWVTA